MSWASVGAGASWDFCRTCILMGSEDWLRVAEIGKILAGMGVLLVLVGAGLMLASRFGLPLGRLPGDVAYRGKHVSVFFPLGTSILISVVLSLLFYLLSRIQK